MSGLSAAAAPPLAHLPIQGMWEQIIGGASTRDYSFNGQLVALRDSSGVSYLHADHLGSITMVTGASGGVWAAWRSGGAKGPS
jgi:hypothetical protein